MCLSKKWQNCPTVFQIVLVKKKTHKKTQKKPLTKSLMNASVCQSNQLVICCWKLFVLLAYLVLLKQLQVHMSLSKKWSIKLLTKCGNDLSMSVTQARQKWWVKNSWNTYLSHVKMNSIKPKAICCNCTRCCIDFMGEKIDITLSKGWFLAPFVGLFRNSSRRNILLLIMSWHDSNKQETVL